MANDLVTRDDRITKEHITKTEKKISSGIKIKLRTKLLISFLAIIIPAAGVLGWGALTINNNSNNASTISEIHMPNALAFIDLEKNVILIQTWLQNIALTKGASGYNQGFEEARKYNEEAENNINKLLERYKDSPKELQKIQEIKENLASYYQVGQEVANTYIDAGPKAGNAMLAVFVTIRTKLNNIIKKYRKNQTDTLINTVTGIKADLKIAKNGAIFSIIIFVGLGLLIALFLCRMIEKPIIKMNDNLLNISEGDGDLTVKLQIYTNDELGEMAKSFNKFITKLKGIIIDVKNSADVLGEASNEISNTANIISDGSRDQAANVEEITSSLEEIGATIEHNTENSRNTDKIASESASVAEDSGNAVTKTVKSMRQIADRINLIEDIAYKTNLLALNAAIEAARAGEHGKGFAVVAGEVRKLAEKSQTASKEISQLAKDSVEISEKSGTLIDELVPKIKKTATLVQDITAATEQQDIGVRQINEGMEQLNTITQQNATSSDDLTSTSETMKNHAINLQKKMRFFKVE